MRFSLISDMHVDFPQNKTPYDLLEKTVVVAGDTSNGLHGLKFLEKLRRKGFSVLATEGNHEHYGNVNQGRTMEETTERFRQDHPREQEIEGIPVFLTPGWYTVPDGLKWFGYMNDGPNMIGGYPEAAAAKITSLAAEEYHWLRSRLESVEKCIVVTHMAPCLETLNPLYEGHYSNQWYWNPLLRRLLEVYGDRILVWCHGHSHYPMDEVVDGVRVVTNPRGYPGEVKNWTPKTIEINP